MLAEKSPNRHHHETAERKMKEQLLNKQCICKCTVFPKTISMQRAYLGLAEGEWKQ